MDGGLEDTFPGEMTSRLISNGRVGVSPVKWGRKGSWQREKPV